MIDNKNDFLRDLTTCLWSITIIHDQSALLCVNNRTYIKFSDIKLILYLMMPCRIHSQATSKCYIGYISRLRNYDINHFIGCLEIMLFKQSEIVWVILISLRVICNSGELYKTSRMIGRASVLFSLRPWAGVIMERIRIGNDRGVRSAKCDWDALLVIHCDLLGSLAISYIHDLT